MAKTAILFPGQRSQTPDMRETVTGVTPNLPAGAAAVGPGRVLTGLAKRTLSGVELVNA